MIYYSPSNPNNFILSDVDRMLDATHGLPMIYGVVIIIIASRALHIGIKKLRERKRNSNVNLE